MSPYVPSTSSPRHSSTKTNSTPAVSEPLTPSQLDDLFTSPAWSVNDLLPSPSSTASTTEITASKLRHLLRLSALPPPSSPAEEQKMLDQLHQQLHFVRQIQAVDVSGVQPLARIQDETEFAKQARTHDLESMKEALDQEQWVGRFNRRVRKRAVGVEKRAEEDWDVLGQAPRRIGGFFVVEGGGGRGKEEG